RVECVKEGLFGIIRELVLNILGTRQKVGCTIRAIGAFKEGDEAMDFIGPRNALPITDQIAGFLSRNGDGLTLPPVALGAIAIAGGVAGPEKRVASGRDGLKDH